MIISIKTLYYRRSNIALKKIELADSLIVSNMLDSMNKSLSISPDLSKAFYTLDHLILLRKMEFYIANLILFNNYLPGRKMLVFLQCYKFRWWMFKCRCSSRLNYWPFVIFNLYKSFVQANHCVWCIYIRRWHNLHMLIFRIL